MKVGVVESSVVMIVSPCNHINSQGLAERTEECVGWIVGEVDGDATESSNGICRFEVSFEADVVADSSACESVNWSADYVGIAISTTL